MNEIVIIMGYPASGKSTLVEEYVAKGYHRLNRDDDGSSIGVIHAKLDHMIGKTKDYVGENPLSNARNLYVLDNLYGTKEHRAQVIAIGKKHNIPVRCVWLNTSIEDAQYNASFRMIRKHGKLINPEEFKNYINKDPGAIPPVVLFNYRKQFERPTVAEGFSSIEIVPFVRKPQSGYVNKAILTDYDGTLRTCASGKYPTCIADIQIIKGVADVLKDYRDKGYLLCGVSNQSGIAKGDLTDTIAKELFAHTNKLLGLSIDVAYCPHRVGPPIGIPCYCRKPLPGLAVHFIEKYKLDASKCIVVGDMKTDRTFAERAGMQFMHESIFFKRAK